MKKIFVIIKIQKLLDNFGLLYFSISLNILFKKVYYTQLYYQLKIKIKY